jgi:hypothetical protein
MRESTNNEQLPSIVPITSTHSRKYFRTTSMASNSQLQYRIIAAYDAATYESAGGRMLVSYANAAMPFPRGWSEKWKGYESMRPGACCLHVYDGHCGGCNCCCRPQAHVYRESGLHVVDASAFPFLAPSLQQSTLQCVSCGHLQPNRPTSDILTYACGKHRDANINSLSVPVMAILRIVRNASNNLHSPYVCKQYRQPGLVLTSAVLICDDNIPMLHYLCLIGFPRNSQMLMNKKYIYIYLLILVIANLPRIWVPKM